MRYEPVHAPPDVTESFRPWNRLAGAVIMQAWRELASRRSPSGTRPHMHGTTHAQISAVRFRSYLSAVRCLLHPRGHWVECLEIDREVLATEVARMLLQHFGEQRARTVARWAIEGDPPTHAPAWWNTPKEGTPHGERTDHTD